MFLIAVEMESRCQFPILFTQREYKEGVEVGTHIGDFAKVILEHWNGTLHCVDPWDTASEYDENQQKTLKTSLGGYPTRLEDYLECSRKLSEFGERAVLHKTISTEAAKKFEDESLDFVYLDGDHRFRFVLEDILAWWPKIKKGGLISGHDVVCPIADNREEGWGRNVQNAISLALPNEDLVLVPDPNGLPWSWYVNKK